MAKHKKRELGENQQVKGLEDRLWASPQNGEGKKPSKATKVPKAAAAEFPDSSPSTSNGPEKERKKKGLKAAATDPPVLPICTGNGSETDGEKKKKEKNASPQSEVARPQLAARPQYDTITRDKWRVELKPDQVVKISMLQNVAAGLERHISSGGEYHGSVSRADKDGVWANLCKAKVYICNMANTPRESLGTKGIFGPKDLLTEGAWAIPLIDAMKSAARASLGANADALLVDIKPSVYGVCRANEKYDSDGNSDLDTLLDAYTKCMGVVSSLWLELCERVRTKFALDPAALETNPFLTDVTRPWKGGQYEKFFDEAHSAMTMSMRLYPHKDRSYFEGPTAN